MYSTNALITVERNLPTSRVSSPHFHPLHHNLLLFLPFWRVSRATRRIQQFVSVLECLFTTITSPDITTKMLRSTWQTWAIAIVIQSTWLRRRWSESKQKLRNGRTTSFIVLVEVYFLLNFINLSIAVLIQLLMKIWLPSLMNAQCWKKNGSMPLLPSSVHPEFPHCWPSGVDPVSTQCSPSVYSTLPT